MFYAGIVSGLVVGTLFIRDRILRMSSDDDDAPPAAAAEPAGPAKPRLQFGRIGIGSDHGGAYERKSELVGFLAEKFPDLKVEDIGTYTPERCDYPDIAAKLASLVQSGSLDGGILVDGGSGVGMCIAANKFEGVRAGVVYSEFVAGSVREHNGANIATFGATTMKDGDEVERCIEKFLTTPFEWTSRHGARVKKFAMHLAPTSKGGRRKTVKEAVEAVEVTPGEPARKKGRGRRVRGRRK